MTAVITNNIAEEARTTTSTASVQTDNYPRFQIRNLVLPKKLEIFKDRFEHNSCLAHNLIQEIFATYYRRDTDLDGKLLRSILRAHWEEWAFFREIHVAESIAESLSPYQQLVSMLIGTCLAVVAIS